MIVARRVGVDDPVQRAAVRYDDVWICIVIQERSQLCHTVHDISLVEDLGVSGNICGYENFDILLFDSVEYALQERELDTFVAFIGGVYV